MTINPLSFGKAIVLNPNLAEIIVDEGIEVDLAMLHEYSEWISRKISDPCMVLLTIMNSYTYSFEAQLALGSFEQIKAVAVLTNSDKVINITDYLKKMPRKTPWNPKIFSIRNEALLWLETRRKQLLNKS